MAVATAIVGALGVIAMGYLAVLLLKDGDRR
ncbi:hypothetical protein FHR31_000852 [Parvibacter caecicola]|uniref:Uncharacterized protein n=1 Tax=Parvibacter caecicola TaxID=747645 RepID=A0A7W5D2N7_9ACTN|nr:hypothetical protein [Parvibacter caecicola]